MKKAAVPFLNSAFAFCVLSFRDSNRAYSSTDIRPRGSPQAYPVDAHLRGLAAHVAYAAAAEKVIQTLEWLGGEAA